MDLSGAAFVTGGGSGIGKACALAFASSGVSGLVVADIDLDAAKATIVECRSVASNPNLRTNAAYIDVASEDSVSKVIKQVVDSLGRIDYCIHAAGIGVKVASPIAEADIAEFHRMLQVNVTGTFLVTRLVSAVMKSQEASMMKSGSPERGVSRGSIVIIGSASAFVATAGMTQYTTAKHAVLGITKNAALDNAKYGIRVNSICPSWVDTPMVRKAMEDVPDLAAVIEAAVPIGRIALADEVADTAMFFCSSIFPAPGLRQIFRHITGQDEQGKSVFLHSDHGDHYRLMVEKQAVANILYSTRETPVDLNNNVDVKKAKSEEPPFHIESGSIVRMIDFGPGVASPVHRALTIDYGIVVEGVFELWLDSGETRIMRQGDVCVQRATAHKWTNITGNGTLPGRMMWVLLDCKPVYGADGEVVEGDLGSLKKEYVGRGTY
ncbi:NAD(P)-binding protein [Plenodomus tracheiphilus IPT5]|uniref:NAD(P)-binding protein n=1 Tax=Plenodomus tracheiphilus IPT5 TaxID=1408161 RepID=A0A6A7B5S8_9PLEO|nr:NAD(P)-binding protein [Plenodomus tracheiphilus IPT5]